MDRWDRVQELSADCTLRRSRHQRTEENHEKDENHEKLLEVVLSRVKGLQANSAWRGLLSTPSFRVFRFFRGSSFFELVL